MEQLTSIYDLKVHDVLVTENGTLHHVVKGIVDGLCVVEPGFNECSHTVLDGNFMVTLGLGLFKKETPPKEPVNPATYVINALGAVGWETKFYIKKGGRFDKWTDGVEKTDTGFKYEGMEILYAV